MSEPRCAGALLAGGGSTRMGRPKAEIELDGTTLAQRAAATLRALTPRVVQVGGEPLPDLDLPHLPDRRRNSGPAAGIETALARCDLPVVALAVDLPFVPAALLEQALRRVARGADICAPHWRGRWHPLCAVYSPSALPRLSARLDKGELSLQELLQRMATALPDETLQSLGDPAMMLFNINTPEDLQAAKKMIKP